MGAGALAIANRGSKAPATPANLALATASDAPEARVVDSRGVAEVRTVVDSRVPEVQVPQADPVPPKHVVIRKHAPAKGSAAAPAAPVVLHKVVVQLKTGWAYFTVEGDATQYQTLATIKLAPGPHVLHFTQGKIQKDVAITVPDSDDLVVVPNLAGN